jgi:hypothetical protein
MLISDALVRLRSQRAQPRNHFHSVRASLPEFAPLVVSQFDFDGVRELRHANNAECGARPARLSSDAR